MSAQGTRAFLLVRFLSRVFSFSLFLSFAWWACTDPISFEWIIRTDYTYGLYVVLFLIKFINRRVLFYRRARSILASSNQTPVDSTASLRRTCRKRFRSRRNTRVVTYLFSHLPALSNSPNLLDYTLQTVPHITGKDRLEWSDLIYVSMGERVCVHMCICTQKQSNEKRRSRNTNKKDQIN